MTQRVERLHVLLASATLLTLTACGGGGGGVPASAPATTTTNVTTKVIDGAITNALVCMDKNINGLCDSDEAQGRSDSSGNVTLAILNADVGKYPMLALVGTDATDADSGPVTQAYAMSAPADQTGVISPLTTLVQQTIATTGATTADAAASIQQSTGVGVSLFQDYTQMPSPTDGSANAATVARMLVIATQTQAAVVASALGTSADDGAVVTQADIDTAIQKKLLELLPELVASLGTSAVMTAVTPADREAALSAAVTTVLGGSGFTPESIATVVAINNQTSSTPLAEPAAVAGFTLHTLNYADASNYFYRALKSTLAQATPDAGNNTRYVDLRVRAVAGNLASWGPYGEPRRGSDLHWNGSAWTHCPINFENTSSVRDAQGNSVYNFCDNAETGKTNRASFDVSGKTMAGVYSQIRAAGYSNMTLASPDVLGMATFPAGSLLFYQTTTPLSEAIGYNPAGADSAAGLSNVVSQYSAAVSAGGMASAQAVGTGCNSAEANTNGSSSNTLDALIAVKTGTPCTFPQGSFVYDGVTYTSEAINEWWNAATVSVGKIGNAPTRTGTAPGYYTTNMVIRAAFTGGGANAVTYYACKERFSDGSVRNCTAIGTGTYTITTLGDGRALELNNPPAQASALNYTRVLVEREGFIYFGYRNKPAVLNTARLNAVGANALLTQIGVSTIDPAAPVTLTAGSYQGTWDFRGAGTLPSTSGGSSVVLFADGTFNCFASSGSFNCDLTLNPATGDFILTDTSGTLSGNFNFASGTATGTFEGADVVGGRR